MSVPKPLSLGLALALSVAVLASAAPAAFELAVAGKLAYGVPHDVVIEGNYAYVPSQGALSVFDIKSTWSTDTLRRNSLISSGDRSRSRNRLLTTVS